VPVRDTQTDRHTHRQTNAGENKGPSGLQLGQQYRKCVSISLEQDRQVYIEQLLIKKCEYVKQYKSAQLLVYVFENHCNDNITFDYIIFHY